MNISELKQNLTLPIIGSPMFLISNPKLVVEQCKNGIIGTFPALNQRTTEGFEEWVVEIKTELEKFEQETGKKPAPFGVNLVVHHSIPRVKDDLKVCIKHKVPLVITSLGAVKDVVDAVHGYGGLVFHDIIKKRHAEKAQEAGVDGLIPVCAGAGGHAGTASPFAMMSEVKSFYDGAIVLAGCISNGRDIAAAKALGADFAYMGTRFINTVESAAVDEYKEMVIDSGISDIIYTDKLSGVNANFMLKSAEAALGSNVEVTEDFSRLDGETKAWRDVWSAGHGVASIDDVPSTEKLIARLREEYNEAIGKMRAAI